MAKIKLNLPEDPFTTQIVTFTAPCGCDQVTDGLVINGETYTICDAMGNKVTGTGGVWCSGAQVSVVLDCENKKAYLQNGNVTLDTIGAASEEHTHDGADITTGLDVLATALGTPRVQTGSYKGNGRGGSNYPNSITFEGVPKLVLVGGSATYVYDTLGNTMTSFFQMLWGDGCQKAKLVGSSHEVAATLTDTTLSWWYGNDTNGDPVKQLNVSGQTYYYVAILGEEE